MDTPVRKFIAAAKAYRLDPQMAELIAKKFFTKKELREGLKRKIHLTYIECV